MVCVHSLGELYQGEQCRLGTDIDGFEFRALETLGLARREAGAEEESRGGLFGFSGFGSRFTASYDHPCSGGLSLLFPIIGVVIFGRLEVFPKNVSNGIGQGCQSGNCAASTWQLSSDLQRH